jgi:hypothetical protein
MLTLFCLCQNWICQKKLTQYFFSCSSSQCLFWFLCWRTTCLQVVIGLSRSWHRNFHKKAIPTTCRFALDRVGLFFKTLWLLVAQTSRFPLAWLLQLMRLTNQVHDYNPFFRETLISLYFAQHTHNPPVQFWVLHFCVHLTKLWS